MDRLLTDAPTTDEAAADRATSDGAPSRVPDRGGRADGPSSAPRLARRRDGQLWLSRNGESHAVQVARCFPWSARGRFISLRDDRRRERWLVEDPRTLDRASRETLEDALVEADFVLEIERIREIDEEIEIRCWDVETNRGPRRFQTQRDEWPRIVPGGGILVRDVAGDLFYIPRPAALDSKSRALLDVFVD